MKGPTESACARGVAAACPNRRNSRFMVIELATLPRLCHVVHELEQATVVEKIDMVNIPQAALSDLGFRGMVP